MGGSSGCCQQNAEVTVKVNGLEYLQTLTCGTSGGTSGGTDEELF